MNNIKSSWFTLLSTLRHVFGNLRNDDGDGNDNATKTIALHMRFQFWYISLPSTAKQQREMTNFKVLWRT